MTAAEQPQIGVTGRCSLGKIQEITTRLGPRAQALSLIALAAEGAS